MHPLELEAVLLEFEDFEGDCDAVSDAISLCLQSLGIEHERFVGYVRDHESGQLVLPHCWLQIDDYVIDYRLQRWLGTLRAIPHGIFVPPERFTYIGLKDDRPISVAAES